MTIATRGGREPSLSRLCFRAAPAGSILVTDIDVSVPSLRAGILIDGIATSDTVARRQPGNRALMGDLAVRGRTKDAVP